MPEPGRGALWFWNQQNFEGLTSVAESIANVPQWQLFADYCQFRERGLRKLALEATAKLVSVADEWPTNDRRRFSNWIYETHLRLPEVHQLIVAPLLKGLLIPTLEEWAVAETDNAVPRRWLGFATRNHEHFSAALSLDAGDDVSRDRLVCRDLADVEYQCHHLPEHFIGEPQDAIAILSRVEQMAKGFKDSRIAPELLEDFGELASKVNDWISFLAEAEDVSFADWCAEKGRKYHWIQHFYY